MAPVSGVKPVIGPDGRIERRPDGRLKLVVDPYQGLRANWPAYLCLIGSAASFGWTLFLVGYGIVVVVRQKTQSAAPDGGPATGLAGSDATEGPPPLT